MNYRNAIKKLMFTGLFVGATVGTPAKATLHKNNNKNVFKTEQNDYSKDYNNNQLIEAAGYGMISKMDKYLKLGADINAMNTTMGITALMNAALKDQVMAVQFLIENGADVNFENVRGETASYCAVQSGNIEILKILKANGAKFGVMTIYGISDLDIANFKYQEAQTDCEKQKYKQIIDIMKNEEKSVDEKYNNVLNQFDSLNNQKSR